MNKKGFTMIELLAVITIMGILMMIAVPSVTKYLNKGREQSMDTALKTAYDAANQYMLDNPVDTENGESVPIATLVERGYMEAVINPTNNGGTCSGSVQITDDNAHKGFNYNFEVTLDCNGKTYTKTFTNGK